MKLMSRNARRAGVIFTFAMLIATVALFYVVKTEGFRAWSAVALSAAVVATIVMSAVFYIRTGLWRFVHRDFAGYDEREAGVALGALRFAYAIFTVVALGLMLIASATAFEIHVVLVAGLILSAHILPASVIAWNEPDIEE